MLNVHIWPDVFKLAAKEDCAISAPPGRKPTSKQSSSSKHICPICEDTIEDQSLSTKQDCSKYSKSGGALCCNPLGQFVN